MIVFCLLILLASPAWAGSAEIHLYNWSDYLPQEVLDQFTQETGIQVKNSTYDSNEALYAKLKLLNGGGYDLVVPSTYFVDKMRREGLLHPIDKSQLSQFQNLDVKHLNKPFDPDNQYSIPYLWGTTGIAVNAAKLNPDEFSRWADLWNPQLKASLLMPNDMREAFHIAFFVLGYHGNTQNPEQVRQAYELLRGLMANIRLFTSDAIDIQFLTGEVNAGVIWNGVAYKVNQEDPNIRYIYPKEGVIIWMDNLAIPAHAPNPANAHKLIDYLLRPDVAKTISEKIGYTSPNREAIQLMPQKLRDNPYVNPPDEILLKGEYQTDIGGAITLYTEYWEKLKTE